MKKLLEFILAFCIVASLWLFLSQAELGEFGATDLIQYWSASQLFLSGQNPYDHSLLAEIQARVVPDYKDPILMWNPPFIFSFITFSTFFSFKAFVAFCLLASSFALLYSYVVVDRVSRVKLAKGQAAYPKYVKLLVIFSFFPAVSCLGLGQISTLLLFGLAGCFYLRAKGKKFWAGVFLALTLVKPQILYLLYLFFFAQSVRRKDYALLSGFLVAGLVFAALPLIFQSDIYQHYLSAIASPPIYWQTPTLGSWLQGGLAMHQPYIRMLPSIFMALIYALYLLYKPAASQSESWPYVLLPLCLLTCPYAWVFDAVLLLPTIVWIFNRLVAVESRLLLCSVPSTMLGAHAMLIAGVGVGQQYFVWYPLVVFFNAVLLKMRAK